MWSCWTGGSVFNLIEAPNRGLGVANTRLSSPRETLVDGDSMADAADLMGIGSGTHIMGRGRPL